LEIFRETRVKEIRGIQTENDTQIGASKNIVNVFRETRVKGRRYIHSDTE
jgi:hypothetical protein